MVRIAAIYIVVGLFCAVILYHLAKAKGAKPLPWAIIGILAGPCALFLIRWLSKQQASAQEANRQDRFKD